MSDNPAKEAFADLLTHLEHLETVTGAILQFMKENGIATDEKLAPYLDQASKASDVRMRAARARMEHLFSADETAKPATEAVPAPSKDKTPQMGASKKETSQPEASQKKDSKTAAEPKAQRPSGNSASEEKPASPDRNVPSEIVSATMETKTDGAAEPGENRTHHDPASQNEAA